MLSVAHKTPTSLKLAEHKDDKGSTYQLISAAQQHHSQLWMLVRVGETGQDTGSANTPLWTPLVPWLQGSMRRVPRAKEEEQT